MPVPVIAAINGYALGGGAELMLACDLRIAGRGARIGFPYVKLGLIAGWHGVERLIRDCGYVTAMELLMTGEPVSAERAERIGLINRAVDDGAELESAIALVEGFVEAAPLALAAAKRVVKAAWRMSPGDLRALMDERFAELWVSKDHREAEAAFAEKRKPQFAGE
ncbi:MAG: enoyl-CoA hydratase/isomerase family protein [Gammaproteobacteria bacterium]